MLYQLPLVQINIKAMSQMSPISQKRIYLLLTGPKIKFPQYMMSKGIKAINKIKVKIIKKKCKMKVINL